MSTDDIYFLQSNDDDDVGDEDIVNFMDKKDNVYIQQDNIHIYT